MMIPRQIALRFTVCLLLGLILTAAASASRPASASDRAASQKLLQILDRALNERSSQLLASVIRHDTQVWPGVGMAAFGPTALQSRIQKEMPWSERLPPHLVHQSVYWITSENAVLTADLLQYGPGILKNSEAVVLLARKTKGEWHIWYVGLFHVILTRVKIRPGGPAMVF